MELNHLREFVVLAKTGNFLEAADSLFISQSSLSKHIKKLEAELGVALFARTTRKVALSEYGQLMLPYAKRIVQLRDEAAHELQSRLERDENALEIGSIPALAPYGITNLLVQFKRACADVALHVTQCGTGELKELLLNGSLELAFIREHEPAQDALVRIPYMSDNLVVMLPAAHPLAGEKQLTLDRLRDEDFLVIGRNNMIYNLGRQACIDSGFEPRIAFTDHKLENLADYARGGAGVVMLMRRLAAPLRGDDLVVIDVVPEVVTHISLCHLEKATLSAAAKHFLRCVKEQTSNIG